MKVLKISYSIICVMMSMWIAASWIDIVADNNIAGAVHHSWNLFTWMFGGVI
jgi:hypothetical protein